MGEIDPMRGRTPIVGVMGSGLEAHADKSEPLGRALAAEGVHLLTGGGAGVMTSVARAFCSVEGRRGVSIGVLPCLSEDRPDAPKQGYPNEWIELPVRTHLWNLHAAPTSRNHINALTPAAIVLLPGGSGTSSEAALAVRYATPVIALLDTRDQVPDLPDEVRHTPRLDDVLAFVRDVVSARRAE